MVHDLGFSGIVNCRWLVWFFANRVLGLSLQMVW